MVEEIKYFPIYLLIGQIVESERGHEEYFNVGLLKNHRKDRSACETLTICMRPKLKYV
jgi:hypothetical protein